MPTITVKQTVIHYAERGSGDGAMLLLHGFPLDSRMWDQVLPQPPQGWRVVIPDLPGFGRSSSAGAFTMTSMADVVHEFKTRLDVRKCVMGGFSMGGYVALAYAKKYPRSLHALMLIDTKAEGDTAEGKQKRDKMIELVQKSGSKAVAEQMLPNMITKEHANDPEFASRVRKIMEACPPETIAHALAGMRDRDDHSCDLPSIADPTLIMVGEHDAITPKSQAEAMHAAIPRSKLVVIPDAGHLAPMENPQWVSREIASYVGSI